MAQEGTCELKYTHNDYTIRTYTRATRQWQEEHADGLYRNMMFAAEDKDISCHCEPARTLVWQSPPYNGDSHASVITGSE